MPLVRIERISTVPGMTEATGKLRYRGGLLGMRELSVYLREQGLVVAVETSEERRDAVATIEAIITFASVPGTVVGLAELAKKAKRAIGKFRNEGQDRDAKIEIIGQDGDGPDDAGFLP
jgi:hypothetical protein